MTNTTGEMLKELRQERGMSLQDVASEIGCSASYLHRIENNSRKNPSMKIVQSLAKFYEIALHEILGIDQGQMPEVLAMMELKKTITEELNEAVTNMQEGLSFLATDDEQSKKHFVAIQKNLLYVQSLLS